MEKDKIKEFGASEDIVYREVTTHGRLIHDNIVRLHAFYEDEKIFYLVSLISEIR